MGLGYIATSLNFKREGHVPLSVFTGEQRVRYYWFGTWGAAGSAPGHTCGRGSVVRPEEGEPPDALCNGCRKDALR